MIQTSNFLPQHFFDLNDFELRDIFDEEKPVWFTVKNLESYLRTFFSKNGGQRQNIENVKTDGEVYIGEGTEIEPFVVILGPCYIGKNCKIKTGAYIRGNSIISDNCLVGHSSEIKNSLLLPGAKAAHFNYVGDSIVGREVNLAAGSLLANVRLDHKTVFVRVGEEKVNTNLDKFGSIIGDYSQVGANSLLNPGTVIGKSSLIYPNSQVLGYHQEGSKIK